MAKRVAVVTGSNKGLGFAIVRALCKQFDGDVYLTARDEGRGKETVELPTKEGLNPQFHQLDIGDHASIVRLRDFLQEKYGGLDVLVNNAGMMGSESMSFGEKAEFTSRTNYFSTLDACEVLFPILKSHARVANVTGGLCKTAMVKCSEEIQSRFKNPNITIDELTALMNEFLEAAKAGDHEAKGFSDNAYGMSKLGATVMSLTQQRDMDKKRSDDIVINACCPGFTNTDMTAGKGTQTPDQGAVTPVFCALLPVNTTTRGLFIRNQKNTPWDRPGEFE